MASLPNPGESRAVLVGVSTYQHLETLEAVANNLTDLAGELTAENVWGLPAANCAVIRDPNTAAEMLDPLLAAAQAATDTLVFYYAGHGLTPPVGSSLHLALPGSVSGRMYTAVPYDHVREALLRSRASRRVVILDCCYSGLALGQMSDPSAALANEASAEGTFLLAAAAENRAAQAPADWRNTAFTTELLAAVREGIPDAGPLLELDSIYRYLDQSLRAKGFPVPQKRDRNAGGQVTLIRNQAYRPPAPRQLVILDCNSLAVALWARFTGQARQDELYRSALRGIVADLADRGEVRGYASVDGSAPVLIALELAEQAGVPVEMRHRGSLFDLVVAATVDVLPSLTGLTLVTGDGGFVAVIEQAQRRNVATTVLSLPEALSSVLAAVADSVVLLELSQPEGGPATHTDSDAAPILAEEPADDATGEPDQEAEPELAGAAEPDNEDQALADELSGMASASDVAFVLDTFDTGQAIRILSLMTGDAATDALAKMSPAPRKKVLNHASPEILAPIIDSPFGGAALLTAMGPERAAIVLPMMSWSTSVFQRLEPQFAIVVLSLLSSAGAAEVLGLSRGQSMSPDPLDGVLDYLDQDQVEDYLSRISPERALRLLAARSQDQADRFFDQLEPEAAAGVFNEMEEDAATAWLARADPDRVALVLEKARLKSATRALRLLDLERQDLLFGRMRPVQAKVLRIGMSRPPD